MGNTSDILTSRKTLQKAVLKCCAYAMEVSAADNSSVTCGRYAQVAFSQELSVGDRRYKNLLHANAISKAASNGR